MDGHPYDVQRLLKNGQKQKHFLPTIYGEHFQYTTSHTDLRKCEGLDTVNQLNPIGVIKLFTKPNCNLCMEERLIILKSIRDKNVTPMNKIRTYIGVTAQNNFPSILPKHRCSR